MNKQQLDKRITSIFVTIDNYGTAQEARDEIRQLISDVLDQVVPEKVNIFDQEEPRKGQGFNTAITTITDKRRELGL